VNEETSGTPSELREASTQVARVATHPSYKNLSFITNARVYHPPLNPVQQTKRNSKPVEQRAIGWQTSILEPQEKVGDGSTAACLQRAHEVERRRSVLLDEAYRSMVKHIDDIKKKNESVYEQQRSHLDSRYAIAERRCREDSENAISREKCLNEALETKLKGQTKVDELVQEAMISLDQIVHNNALLYQTHKEAVEREYSNEIAKCHATGSITTTSQNQLVYVKGSPYQNTITDSMVPLSMTFKPSTRSDPYRDTFQPNHTFPIKVAPPFQFPIKSSKMLALPHSNVHEASLNVQAKLPLASVETGPLQQPTLGPSGLLSPNASVPKTATYASSLSVSPSPVNANSKLIISLHNPKVPRSPQVWAPIIPLTESTLQQHAQSFENSPYTKKTLDDSDSHDLQTITSFESSESYRPNQRKELNDICDKYACKQMETLDNCVRNIRIPHMYKTSSEAKVIYENPKYECPNQPKGLLNTMCEKLQCSKSQRLQACKEKFDKPTSLWQRLRGNNYVMPLLNNEEKEYLQRNLQTECMM